MVGEGEGDIFTEIGKTRKKHPCKKSGGRACRQRNGEKFCAERSEEGRIGGSEGAGKRGAVSGD